MKPPIDQELWGKWQSDLPSGRTLLTYLIRDRGFSAAGAKSLILEYKETIQFAKLSPTDGIPVGEGPGEEVEDPPKQDAKVGDLVQAEIGGVLMPPDRVREARENDGQKWVFLETSTTGVEMERVQVLEKAPAGSPKPPPSSAGSGVARGTSAG